MPMQVIEPKDAEYPHVPTPKEHELSRQVVDLQQEKDAIELKLMTQIKDLEAQIHKLQVRVQDLSQHLQATKREQIQSEQAAIEQERAIWRVRVEALQTELDQEKNDKEAQKKWRVKFTEADNNAVVDPVDDALARFAQSIALLPASAAPKATQAGVLPFLVHLLRENFSDVVTGSVLMALVHLAIYQKPQRPTRLRSVLAPATEAICVKEEIVKAGVAAPLAHILESVRNARVLVEGARLCAALSGDVPNKRVLAAKNIVRHLIQLLLPRSDDGTPDDAMSTARRETLPLPGPSELQHFGLSALVNLAYDSEILRSQIVNFDFIPIAVRYLRESPVLTVQAEAAKLLGNLAFNHVVNQSAILTAEGDAFLTRRLTATYMHQSADLVRASAVGVGNLAYTSVNQLSIGYGDATTFLLQLLVDATQPLVLEAAAIAICGLCHQNPLNKSRVAAQNGLQVLLYVIGRSQRYGHNEAVLIAALECFAIVAKPKPARQQVMELDGHLPICQFCKKSNSEPLLIAAGMAICALIPASTERSRWLADGKEYKLETQNVALSALERVKHQVYATRTQATPSWLARGIAQLTSYASSKDPSGKVEEEEEPTEFHERSYYSMESLTEIEPDELCPGFYD
ncbi:hypothetical protein Poli38472_011251 [Pythium oligandrum]|uniref:Uncharacterized protein n=1 Tax=Pythium oligandrum TaxID=41045 RepID=A0A8K1CS29_PYTOL|nr:hypothetical protein Poli38472_011251 [Pythium oligandrum]|eukprot:TMW67631.1 hypothetical protein Poli38472_011251 [Pythium oligandrum]